MFSINLTHSKAYKASSAPNGTSPDNHLDLHLKQLSAQFTGAYAPLGPCPPGAQAQPPSPSTSHLGLPTGSKRKYGTKLGDTATRKVWKAPKRVLDLPPLAATAGIGPSLQRNVSVPLPSPLPILPSRPVPPTYVASDQTNNPTKELKGQATGALDCWIHLLGVHKTGPDLPSNPNVVKAAKEEWVRQTKGYLPKDLRRPNDKFPRLLCLHCLASIEDAGNFDNVTGKDVTPKGLAWYIAELVADQDLAFNIIQAKTFRRLLCYVGQGNIQASDIPEQQSVAKVSSDLSQKEKERLKEDMKNSQGRISFTSDLWTDSMERPFMAVTVVEGAHAGTILARHLFGVLKEYDVVHKNLQGWYKQKVTILTRKGTKFGCPPTKRTKNYVLALKKRPDKKCQATVVALRKGQRWVALRQTIIKGNEQGHFKRQQPTEEPGPDGTIIQGWAEAIVKLQVVELLLDVPTRWSSTCLMLDCFVEQYPAIWEYLSKNKEAFSDLIMSDLEYQILQDILACLDVPHQAQELLSAEQTPTLLLAFPVYDQLIYSWRQVGKCLGPYAYAVECGIAKIEEYVTRSQSLPIHIVAMVLNPCLKYTWIDAQWTPNKKKFARETVKRFMLQHLEAHERRTAVVGAPENLSTKASRAQGQGSPEIPAGMLPTPQRLAPNMFASSPYASSPSKSASELFHCKAIVNAEHEQYINNKILHLSELGKTDLVKHWKSAKSTFSLMHALAMDVLPAQALSVSSKRVFLSSKLTCTRARNKMKANTVESLQILKYALCNWYQATKTTDHGKTIAELHKSKGDNADKVNSLPALDLMVCLGNTDWSHNAILDVDLDH
ncbi:hypothetical protein RhiTH_003636 [Rhizoctonia solani]